jgi:hypothetical protein
VPNAPKSAGQTVAAKDLPFEEGTRLVKTCQTKLEEAELKISKLEKNAAGEPVLKPAGDILPDNE